MCHIYRRTIDTTTGEYRRGEYVGYVDTSHHGVSYKLDGTAMPRAPDPPKVMAKPRFRLVADLREWRAWRRYRQAGGEDITELPSYKCTCTPTPTPEAEHRSQP